MSITTDALVDLPYRRKLLVIVALSATLFVTSISQTVVATAAQSIVSDIGGFNLFTWLFAGFSLAGAVIVPIVGKLSDVVGRKTVILWALGVFVVASMAAGFSQTMTQLVIIRVIQGAGFAGAMGSVWIIMAAMWAPEQRAKWMGVTTASFTLSGVLGPIIGGVVSDFTSWRIIFFMNVPLGGMALLLLWIWLPGHRTNRGKTNFDIAGTTAFVIFSTAILFGFSIGGDSVDWISPVMGLLGLTALVGFVSFVWIELRASDPLIPIALFKSRVFSGAMVGSLTITMGFITTTAFLPLFVQGAKGATATQSAYPLMTLALGVAVGANVSGQLLSRFNRPREGGVFGMTIAGAILWYVGGMTTSTSMLDISLATIVLGIGMSFGWTSFTAPVQNAMPPRVLGVVTSSLQFARMFGMAAAAAALGSIMASGLTANFGSDLTGPAAAFEDAELLISDEELESVRLEFIAHPDLDEDAYFATLATARTGLADALSVVFRISAVACGIGVPVSMIAFHNYRVWREEDELEGAAARPLGEPAPASD
ncbi:MAG: MFS transporter [Chloroflexi bacterium]|nr:MFS transporter [Chloroflexota bacterium]